MREYIIAIVGAALLSVFADIASPETWKKYIKIITGLVIISVIVSPIAKIRNADLFLAFDADKEVKIEEVNYQKQLVLEEFTKLVQSDAKEKIKKEYGLDADVKANVKLNKNMEIEKVNKIIIYMDNPPENLKSYMAQIYGLKNEEVILHG